MEMKYLALLQATDKGPLKNMPLSLASIEYLEDLYNDGIVFPGCLRELLFIAGEYCVVLDYSLCENQEEIQDYANELLNEGGVKISRPFYAIDFHSDGSQFIYVYLDEESDDPIVNVAYIRNIPGMSNFQNLNKKLSEFIKSRILTLRDGFNPF